jgi:hypothetical protein
MKQVPVVQVDVMRVAQLSSYILESIEIVSLKCPQCKFIFSLNYPSPIETRVTLDTRLQTEGKTNSQKLKILTARTPSKKPEVNTCVCEG